MVAFGVEPAGVQREDVPGAGMGAEPAALADRLIDVNGWHGADLLVII
jgi:hypothetical protein